MATPRHKAPDKIYLVEHRYGYENGFDSTKYIVYDTIGPARSYRTKANKDAARVGRFKYHHVYIYETTCAWTLTEDSQELGLQELLSGLKDVTMVE